MDRHRMSGYKEPEPEDEDETEKKKKAWGKAGGEGKEASDEDLKCFHYWLPDANMR